MSVGQALHLVEAEREVPVTPEIAFDCWTQPEHVSRWFRFDGTWTCETSELNVVEGGGYHLAMRSPDGSLFSVRGVFHEVRRGERLTYSWEVDGEGFGETLVTVNFLTTDKGTLVRLVHEQFTDAEAAVRHANGWENTLNQFVSVVLASGEKDGD